MIITRLYKRKSKILVKQFKRSYELGKDYEKTVEYYRDDFELSWIRFWISFISEGGLKIGCNPILFLIICIPFAFKNKWEFIMYGGLTCLYWFIYLIIKYRNKKKRHY